MGFSGGFTSPARKRTRLSSPTYDTHDDDFGSDDLKELDRIETSLSQLIRSTKEDMEKQTQPSQALSDEAKQRRMQAIMAGLRGPDEAEETSESRHSTGEKREREDTGSFMALGPNFNPATLPSVAEQDARSLRFVPRKSDYEPSPSPEEPLPEPDFSKWFEPPPVDPAALPGFRRLSTSFRPPLPEASASSGSLFASARDVQQTPAAQASPWIEPSKQALELAAKKMKEWTEEEMRNGEATRTPDASDTTITFDRPVLASVTNSPSFQPSVSTDGHETDENSGPSATGLVTAATPGPAGGKEKNRGFRSPLMGNASPRTLYPKSGVTSGGVSGSPFRPAQSAGRPPGTYVSKSGRPHPLASTPITASPERPSRSASENTLDTPSRAINNPVPSSVRASTPASGKRAHKSTFTTPFKRGMKPGEPGRVLLETQRSRITSVTPGNATGSKTGGPTHRTLFAGDGHNKIALRFSGLVPQRYTLDELESFGINANELNQITPQTAPFYNFYTPSVYSPSTQSMTAPLNLGPTAAFAHLMQLGWSLATQEWVTNHWSLILWKLAGLACLDPHREATERRRWCWGEVLRQLENRYKKELHLGVRPPLRLITTEDAPAAVPMVLCVSNIIKIQSERRTRNGEVIPAVVELEVTDGWYRLRATLDETLVRAVQRGMVKAGRKLAIAGARLQNMRKDPAEILQAYESCTLQLSGNATHLAPWHAKLGFQAQPFVATLNSLTPDGGVAVLMDFTVEKVHPIGFMEYLIDESGKSVREGPRTEADEAEVADKWKSNRDAEEAKLREELGVRWARWDGFADRLERAAGNKFNPSEDEMQPDHIDELYDEFNELPAEEIATFIRGLSHDEAGWLARYFRRKTERDKELASEEIECELAHICIPRTVREFRVVFVRDTHTNRRPGHRRAQLTIWDVFGLCVSEGGKGGAIEEGQRFRITNLIPTHANSWMGLEEGSDVYLSSRRDSKFIRLK